MPAYSATMYLAVAGAIEIRAAFWAIGAEVEYLAHLDASRGELIPDGHDVRDDQVPLA